VTLPDVSALPRFVLASQSPRRAELLAAAGLEFDTLPVDVDESRHDDEPPEAYVIRLARAKAASALARASGRPVLAADTVVVVDGLVLGKPRNDREAAEMLNRLSGRTHEVVTGVVLLGEEKSREHIETTRVTFGSLSRPEIDSYVATGEPLDKAGAYAVQGYASRFVSRIEGSYSNVVGLPIADVYRLLRGWGGG
jgi:septum formation protein